MSHYFTDNRNLEKNRRELSFRFWCFNYTLESDDGVFAKDGIDYGTRVLLDTFLGNKHEVTNILDFGCGYGVVGVVLKRHFPTAKLTMCDINPRALDLTRDNLKRYSMEANVVESDLFKNITEDSFSDILSNPPIHAGKKVVYNIFEQSYHHLQIGGSLWVVIRKQHGSKSAMRKIEDVFGNCELLKKDNGFWILRAIKN